MYTKNASIALLILFCVLLNTCAPGDACFKKIRALLRNKGKEEKPAELAKDEASYIKYSNSARKKKYLFMHP